MIRLLLSLFLLSSSANAGLFDSIKSAIDESKSSSQSQESGGTQKKGLLSTMESAASKVQKTVSPKKTPDTQQSTHEDEPKEQSSGLFGTLQSVASKVTKSGTNKDDTPKPSLLTRAKEGTLSLVSSIDCSESKCGNPSFMTPQKAHNCLSTVDRARTNINCSKAFVTKICATDKDNVYSEKCDIARQAIGESATGLGKMADVTSKAIYSAECTAEKCGDPGFMTPDKAHKCLATIDFARTNINCSKAFAENICATDKDRNYTTSCEIAQQALQATPPASQSTPQSAPSTAQQTLQPIPPAGQCPPPQCGDSRFMTLDKAKSCFATPEQAQANIDCARTFVPNICEKDASGHYTESCQIARQALLPVSCSPNDCRNPALGRHQLYRCLGTPALINRNQTCANAYYTTYCQQLRSFPSHPDRTRSLPHGTEFCNRIAQYRGEPGFGSAPAMRLPHNPNIPLIATGGSCHGVLSYRDKSSISTQTQTPAARVTGKIVAR